MSIAGIFCKYLILISSLAHPFISFDLWDSLLATEGSVKGIDIVVHQRSGLQFKLWDPSQMGYNWNIMLYCKSFQRDHKNEFDHHANELVVDYIPCKLWTHPSSFSASAPEWRVQPCQCWNLHQNLHCKDHRQVNVSKSCLQVGEVKLQSHRGKLRYELAQWWELVLSFDSSITGNRIFSFCIEPIAVMMNKKVVSSTYTAIQPNTGKSLEHMFQKSSVANCENPVKRRWLFTVQ